MREATRVERHSDHNLMPLKFIIFHIYKNHMTMSLKTAMQTKEFSEKLSWYTFYG